MYAFTYSYIHIIYAYIHILSYTCFYCQMLLYCISYYLLHHAFTMPIIHVHILILVLCHLLLLSIVLRIYAFLSFVLSMFYLFILAYLSYIHTIFIFPYSFMNLLYLEIGIIPIGSSKLKLWHFHAKLINLPITLGTVCITHFFFGVLTSYLTLYLYTFLNLRC